MKLQTLFTVAALSLVAVTAHAAPQDVVKLPRVVITGKATPTVAQVHQLPRVVIVGYSQDTLARQTLAAVSPKVAVRKI